MVALRSNPCSSVIRCFNGFFPRRAGERVRAGLASTAAKRFAAEAVFILRSKLHVGGFGRDAQAGEQ